MKTGMTLVPCKNQDHENLTSKLAPTEHEGLLVGVQLSQQHTLVFSFASVEGFSSLLVVHHQLLEMGSQQFQ
jgi:hypothetical protein